MALKQASVSDIRKQRITRKHGKIVLTMCHYPRGVERKLVDKYVKSLAPNKTLLTTFLKLKDQLGDHNQAFAAARYETLFHLTEEGMEELEVISNESKLSDVFLVCQCNENEKCHRDLLLILAEEMFGAKVCKRQFSFNGYSSRIAKMGKVSSKIEK